MARGPAAAARREQVFMTDARLPVRIAAKILKLD